MSTKKREQWSAASGYLAFALGFAGAAFERGAPEANAPIEEFIAYVTMYQGELLAQSLMFVLSAGVYIWFFGSLRSFLLGMEGDTGRLSNVMLGAGVIWVVMQLILQSVQVAMANNAHRGLDQAQLGMMVDFNYALSVVAYVPLAFMLFSVAVVCFRTRAFPEWLTWFTCVFGAFNLVMSLGIIVESGPLVPGKWLTYLLYGLMPIWLLAITTIMIARLRSPLAA